MTEDEYLENRFDALEALAKVNAEKDEGTYHSMLEVKEEVMEHMLLEYDRETAKEGMMLVLERNYDELRDMF